MNKTYYFFILSIVFLLSFASCKDKTTSPITVDNKLGVLSLKEVFENKNQWLIDQNYEKLNEIVHPQLKYGHSNCWIQSAGDILDKSNPDSLTYLNIDINHIDVDMIQNVGIVEGQGKFKGVILQDTFELDLCFIETYIHDKGKWLLITRQSSKVPQK